MHQEKIWEKGYFPYLLIMIAGLCVYARSLGYGFLFYDDPRYVVQNDLIAGLRQAVGEGYNDVVSMEKNPDLLSLAGDPEYKSLLADARRGVSR